MEKLDLDTLLVKWQKILRLQDWDLRSKYVRIHDIKEGTEGCCSASVSNKSAIIKILDPQDFEDGRTWEQDIEQTLVHELIHLHLMPFEHARGTEQKLMEQAVECIASGFVKLDRT